MSFSALVSSPGRLRILTALATRQSHEFVQLRLLTRLSDGNLSAHAKRLSTAGLIEIDKTFRGAKPLTLFRLTPAGRLALEEHARAILSAVAHDLRSTSALPGDQQVTHPSLDDNWVD
jgi:DNA-binding MarR family transcriptional regulator